MAKKVLITTPIYYASGNPHIGHAYTTVLADVLKDYYRLLGYNTYLVTGMDEHGQKIHDKAEAEGIEPLEFVNNVSKIFINLWSKLNIKYDSFIRTTDKDHVKYVQSIFAKYNELEKIYKGDWKGYYCPNCEESKSNSEIINDNGTLKCDIGHNIELKDEEAFFYKINDKKNWLVHKCFKKMNIIPDNRKNELLNSFINNLLDLCITRTKNNWGINTIIYPNHYIYVWLDALFSYISGLNKIENLNNKWNKFNKIIHLMSKEIIRFHCIYWPIFLNDLKLKIPTDIISHGWIITESGKMSKSLNNVIDPFEIINKYGSDQFRYFLLKEIPIFNDGVYSEKLLIECINSDLSNNIGNLYSRFNGMLAKYFNSEIPEADKKLDIYKIFKKTIKAHYKKIKVCIKNFQFNEIIKIVLQQIYWVNKLIEDNKPWELFKNENTNLLKTIINIIAYNIKFVYIVLSPIIKEKSLYVIKKLCLKKYSLKSILNFIDLDYLKIDDNEILFKRIEQKNN